MKISYLLTLLFILQIYGCTEKFSQNRPITLVILHTNDTHSQVEPTHKNLGGYLRRMGIIQKIRNTEPNVLLFDAGDFFQGTPYFNFFNGRVEIDAYNRMQYDAITLGNHEFDNGIDTLAAILQSNTIPIVCSNYDFTKTPLAKMVKPYVVLTRGGLRIGVLGIGPNPSGLILERNFKDIKYYNPILVADSISALLKNKLRCDIVICLSHLGTDPEKNDVTDYDLAAATQHIEIILGGHSHQIITNSSKLNRIRKPVIIAQMGKSGEYLGRIDLVIKKQKL